MFDTYFSQTDKVCSKYVRTPLPDIHYNTSRKCVFAKGFGDTIVFGLIIIEKAGL